jgi:predicted RND superfamily exporter protein
MRKPFFARFSLPILMAFFFVTPFLIQGAHRAIRSNTNKVSDWLPKTFKETVELRWFRQHFVADQFVVVSWEGCELGDDPSLPNAKPDDPRIERLAKYLVPRKKSRKGLPSAADLEADGEHTKYFQSVTTGRRLLNELTSEPSKVPYNIALKRLQGTVIGPDGKQTCLVIMLSDEAIKDFRGVVGRWAHDGPWPWNRKQGVLLEALAKCGVDPEQARLGGPPVENVAIDEEGERTLARLAVLSGILGLGLAWWSLRSIRLTLIVFACGVLSAAAGLAFVNWTGQTTDAVMMCMPSMVYVLAISGAVHLVNYYRDAIHEGGLEGAPERAIRHGWKPAFLCNVTTGIGMASLATADLEPIRKFGIYAAAGVAMMLIFLFLLLPAALQIWPLRAARHKKPGGDYPDGQKHLGEGTIWYEEYWLRTSHWIIRHHVGVSVGCFALIAAMGLGLTRITTDIDLLKLFDEGVRVRRDYVWLEKNVGLLVPLEVVVRFPEDKLRSADASVDAKDAVLKYSYLERLEFVSLVQQTIDKELGLEGANLVGPSLSAVTFAPPLPTGTDAFAWAERKVTDAALEDSHAALSRSGYLTFDDSEGIELWRISLRAAAFANLDYGAFVNSVRAVVEPALAAQRLREHVLQQVITHREDHSIAGASVCLWQRKPSGTSASGDVDVRSPRRQQEIFTATAQQLLAKARLNLQAADGDVINFSTMNEAERKATLGQFKKFACVVAIGNLSDAEIGLLTDAGVRVVDSRRMVKRLTEEPQAPNEKAVYAIYTGVVPIVYKAQRALLDSLIQSSFWSFITITPLMMLVCRSIAGGAVVMLPNVLPVLVVFGGMGWLGIPIDIGSMMASSIALGVAVDDTIHFLSWYREDLKKLGDRKAAIAAAYGRCGPPTLQAALISGLSLSVFAFSTFTPTQRLGWLMMTILICGVIAELVMMPAILAGPLGRAIPVRRPPAPPAAVPVPHTAKQRRASLVTSQT